jgi:hypothetical protein
LHLGRFLHPSRPSNRDNPPLNNRDNLPLNNRDNLPLNNRDVLHPNNRDNLHLNNRDVLSQKDPCLNNEDAFKIKRKSITVTTTITSIVTTSCI